MKSIPVIAGTLIACMVQSCSAQMTDDLRDFILSEHNRLRATVRAEKMFELEYDMDLECAARTYVERSNGKFSGHNANRLTDYEACARADGREPEFDNWSAVGENWYSGSPRDSTTGGASNSFVDFVWPKKWGFNDCSERQNYAAEENDIQALLNNEAIKPECKGGMVGHYTQVMADRTKKVGCWFTESFGTLCNYGPAGNFNNLPYVTYGQSCSKCPSGTICRNGLCALAKANDENTTPSTTPSRTPTQTPSRTPTQTPSRTPTQTPSRTPTQTPSRTPTQTPARTPSRTPAHTPSQTPASTPNRTPTGTPSQTPIHQIPTSPPIVTPSHTPTETPTLTPSATPVRSASPKPSIEGSVIVRRDLDEDTHGVTVERPETAPREIARVVRDELPAGRRI
eukprot:CFRG6967T1